MKKHILFPFVFALLVALFTATPAKADGPCLFFVFFCSDEEPVAIAVPQPAPHASLITLVPPDVGGQHNWDNGGRPSFFNESSDTIVVIRQDLLKALKRVYPECFGTIAFQDNTPATPFIDSRGAIVINAKQANEGLIASCYATQFGGFTPSRTQFIDGMNMAQIYASILSGHIQADIMPYVRTLTEKGLTSLPISVR